LGVLIVGQRRPAMEGLISCRARVELCLIVVPGLPRRRPGVPGRTVAVSDKGVAARVDLGEALAAKAALEDAGVNALDAVILRHAEAQEKKK